MISPSVLAGTEATAYPDHTKDSNVLYQYTPIENTNGAIRLLILRGGTGPDIDCDLVDFTIDNCDRPYEAISYIWGPEFASDLIKIRGKDLPVTFNLGLILRDLRSPDVDRVIWVDAVCINQQDATEKGHQVAQMKDIFRSAKCVLFCICRPTEHTDFLMDSLKKLEASLQDTKSGKRHSVSNSWREIQTLIARQHTNPHQPQFEASLQRQVKALTLLHRQGLEYILNQPWFLRVWILQEVANASSAIIYCGRKSISAVTFALMPQLLDASIPRGRNGLVAHVLSLMPGPLRAHVSQELYPLLQKFRHSLATVERDKIYALFGICQDIHIDKYLSPNYVKFDQDVIRDTISYMCQVEVSTITNSRFNSMSYFLGNLDCLDNILLSDFLYARDHRTALSHIMHRGEYILLDLDLLTLASTNVMMKGGVMALLLELRGADILFSDWGGWHSTCIAAENGHDALASSMLEKVTDIDTFCSGLEAVKYDMEKVTTGLDYFRSVVGTRLFRASAAGNTNLVRLLLEKGADIEKKSEDGDSPLIIAAKNGHHAIVSLLLEKGADTSDAGSPYHTLLVAAVMGGHDDTIRVLLAHNTDFNYEDSHSESQKFIRALSAAAQYCQPSALSLLLGTGVHVSQEQISELLDYALSPWVFDWETDPREPHNQEFLVSMLLEKGAQPSRSLKLALRNGNGAIVQSLIEHQAGGSAVNERLFDRFPFDEGVSKRILGTPLSFATIYGNVDLVRLLLNSGAKHEIRDDTGRTPLLWAARQGQRDIVEILLDAGAEIQAEDTDQQTPLGLATFYGHRSVIELLIRRGAV